MLGGDKLAVNIQCSKVINQSRNAPPTCMVKHVIEQAGFARSQKAGDDGKRGRGRGYGDTLAWILFQVFDAVFR